MLKIFEVQIDNDPGGWKSGEDLKILAFAESKEEAIGKVSADWDRMYNNGHKILYGINHDKKESISLKYISKKANLSAIEICFNDYHIKISNRDTIIDELLEEDETK